MKKDYVKQSLEKLIVYRGTNFEQLLKEILLIIQNYADNLELMKNSMNIHTAFGKFLDFLGEIIGLKRFPGLKKDQPIFCFQGAQNITQGGFNTGLWVDFENPDEVDLIVDPLYRNYLIQKIKNNWSIVTYEQFTDQIQSITNIPCQYQIPKAGSITLNFQGLLPYYVQNYIESGNLLFPAGVCFIEAKDDSGWIYKPPVKTINFYPPKKAPPQKSQSRDKNKK